MSHNKPTSKATYSAPVLQVLPTDDTMGKTFAKGGEGYFKTTGAGNSRSVTGGGAAGIYQALTPGVSGGADKKVNYDES